MTQTYQRVRRAAVAGRFYEGDAERCRAEAQRLCRVEDSPPDLPAVIHGAVVPHAGWAFSGALAGRTLALMRRHTKANTVVLTGTVHVLAGNGPTMDTADAWETPLGPVAVDAELRHRMAGLPDYCRLDMAHENEHSLEVPLPLLREAFGESLRIVPCLVPPHPSAPRWGRALGELLRDWREPVVVISSSDLTHYGPNYRFTPQGVGEQACRWAHEVNDQRLLDIVAKMDPEAVLPETQRNHNACGGGSIAFTIAAVRAMGATTARLIDHTNSGQVLAAMGRDDATNTVGYAGIVFGR